MPAIIIIFYLAGCIVCGIMGRHTTIGFFGHLLLAFVITPPLAFLVQVVGRPSRKLRDEIEKARFDRR
jgi:hypothetical protein